MATQTQILCAPLDAQISRSVNVNFAENPCATWTTSASGQHGGETRAYQFNSTQSAWTYQHSSCHQKPSQRSNRFARIATTIPIRLRMSPERQHEDTADSYLTSSNQADTSDSSYRAEKATAITISQLKPQPIDIRASSATIETARAIKYRRLRSPTANASDVPATSSAYRFDLTPQQQPSSTSSWESQTTSSDTSSFPTIESTTSASTTTSTHEIVKGFTPGGPPSMYRSQSNLTKLSRLVASRQIGTQLPRKLSVQSDVLLVESDRRDECSIEDEEDNEESCSDLDDSVHSSGLTMLFGSKGTIKPSKVCHRPYTLSSRKTRNEMLAAELTKPIQESLLQDRQHKRQINKAFLRRSQSEILHSDCYFTAGIFQYW